MVYDIKDGYINGVTPNTSVELFMKYFDTENCYIEVIGSDLQKNW